MNYEELQSFKELKELASFSVFKGNPEFASSDGMKTRTYRVLPDFRTQVSGNFGKSWYTYAGTMNSIDDAFKVILNNVKIDVESAGRWTKIMESFREAFKMIVDKEVK